MPSPTSWTLYDSNEQAWAAMLADCAKAKKSILLEQYIFVADDTGNKLIDICAERAANGVEVRFLWDAAGSFTFVGSNIVRDLKAKGIKLIFWKTLVPGYFKVHDFRSWFFRNHRRTLVIDGDIGYTGSICVDDRMKNWRDTNVRLEGTVTREMENAFELMWERAVKTRPQTTRHFARDREFRYVTNYPAPGRRHVYAELVHAIRHAEDSIYITSPYFVPTHRLARALKMAALRGVDVSIVIPEKSNYYSVDLAARSFFKMFLECGVHIFLYQGNMIHSKTAIIDGTWSSVGTMNMDSISLLYNFEANIISTNSQFAKELSAHFANDMSASHKVSLAEWRDRFFIEKIPEILIRLVRKFL